MEHKSEILFEYCFYQQGPNKKDLETIINHNVVIRFQEPHNLQEKGRDQIVKKLNTT